MGKKSANKKSRRQAVEKAKALGFDDAAIEAMQWDPELGFHVDREDQTNGDGNKLPPVIDLVLCRAIESDDVAMLAASVADCEKCKTSILDVVITAFKPGGQRLDVSVFQGAVMNNARKCTTWLIRHSIQSKNTKIEDDCFELMAFLERSGKHGRYELVAEPLVQAYVDLGQIHLLRTKLNQRRGADLRRRGGAPGAAHDSAGRR